MTRKTSAHACRDEGCPEPPKHLSVTQPSCPGARKVAPPNGPAWSPGNLQLAKPAQLWISGSLLPMCP
jgi:hypothetical protein